MQAVNSGGVTLHVADTGRPGAPALVFSNSLGTDFRIWDGVVARLPSAWRMVRYDKRGHGLSDCPPGEWGMNEHIADLAAILDTLDVPRAVLCGLSVGGLIVQGVATRAPDKVAALILCDTAAKIGNEAMWNERIAAVEAGGVEALAEGILQRWFPAPFRDGDPHFPLWRNMLVRTPRKGYANTARGLRDTDFTEPTRRLTVPTLALVGSEDGSTPPDLVRSTAELIAGSRFEVIKGAGHLPCVDKPDETAALIHAAAAPHLGG